MRQDAGVDGDAQRISQMVWMFFLKVHADKEQELEALGEYEPAIPEQFRWKNWAAEKDEDGNKRKDVKTGDELQEFIDHKLFAHLRDKVDINATAIAEGQKFITKMRQNMHQHLWNEDDDKVKDNYIEEYRKAVVKSVFEDSYNYMKSGILLRQVVNKINEIDFNKVEDRHLFNDIYEKILKDLQSAGNAGEYYTPRAVTQFIVDMLDPKLGETVLDPACGTGGFLVCAADHLKKQLDKIHSDDKFFFEAHQKSDNSLFGDIDYSERERFLFQTSIMGIEKKPLPHLLCMTNFILHDIEVPQVFKDNSLASFQAPYPKKDRVDVIITNPPFGGVEEDGTESSFPSSFRTKETADLFLVLILNRLKENGRCGIVLPDGTLFGEGVKTRIKEELLTKCNLHTIVRLPNGVFAPYTSIKTNILFFEKGKPTKEIWYFEHPYPPGYKSYSKTKPIQIKEFDLEKAWWKDRENKKYEQYAWKVSIEEIKKRNYNLDFKNPYVEEVEVRDPEVLLKEYHDLMAEIAKQRNALKEELVACLKSTSQ